MGEYVESSLEKLLPVFEQLTNVELFSEDEVQALIKRCRRFEYRLQKRSKSADDFILYGEYLLDVLKLIRSRRAKADYHHKKNLIERLIEKKIHAIYRTAAERFKTIDHWRRLIDYLKTTLMYMKLSTTYTRALQVYSRNIDLRCEAALWEFFVNHSAENARSDLQMALRSNPNDRKLFTALFKVECHYVLKIINRRSAIISGNVKKTLGNNYEEDRETVYDVDVDDAVMELKVANVILSSAVKSVNTLELGETLYDMWIVCNECISIPNMPDLKSRVETFLEQHNDEYLELMNIEKKRKEGKDIFILYDEALAQRCTEKMHRLYLSFCDSVGKEDGFCSMKRNNILRSLVRNGWANQKDLAEFESSILLDHDEQMLHTLEKAVEADPSSSTIQAAYIKIRLDDLSDTPSAESIDAIQQLFNQAFEKIHPSEAFPIWELAIDFAIVHLPTSVESLFAKAALTAAPEVNAKIKLIRIEYLEALVDEGKLSLEKLKDKIYKLISAKPNSVYLYSKIAEKEMNRSDPSDDLIRNVWESAITEHSKESVEAWMGYIRYLYKNNPIQVGKLYQRAMLSLEDSLCQSFLAEFTKLQQSEALKVNKMALEEQHIINDKKMIKKQEKEKLNKKEKLTKAKKTILKTKKTTFASSKSKKLRTKNTNPAVVGSKKSMASRYYQK